MTNFGKINGFTVFGWANGSPMYNWYGEDLTENVSSIDVEPVTPIKKVIYSVQLPDVVPINSILQITTQSEYTNPYSYWVQMSRAIIIADSNTATTGTNVTKNAAENGGTVSTQHHYIMIEARQYKTTAELAGKYINLVVWAMQSAAGGSDTLTVEQGYGHLDVHIISPSSI